RSIHPELDSAYAAIKFTAPDCGRYRFSYTISAYDTPNWNDGAIVAIYPRTARLRRSIPLAGGAKYTDGAYLEAGEAAYFVLQPNPLTIPPPHVDAKIQLKVQRIHGGVAK